MKEKLLGRNHVEVALTLNNLAVIYKTQGRFDAAAELYRRALSCLEPALSPRHPNLIQCRKNYAALLRASKLKEQMRSRSQRV
jgi:tetratricopeptide (TPR) repeat protein